jgi:hypothetical protein
LFGREEYKDTPSIADYWAIMYFGKKTFELNFLTKYKVYAIKIKPLESPLKYESNDIIDMLNILYLLTKINSQIGSTSFSFEETHVV